MTVGGWILFAVVAIAVASVAIWLCLEAYSIGSRVLIVVTSMVIVVSVLAGMLWWFNSTEAGHRAMKSQKSNFEGGIERTVNVYDVNGGLIREYTGKFDVDYDDNRIIFDDDNGKRHVIYYPTGTVIIDEV